MEVEGDDLRIEVAEESLDGGREFGFVEFTGQLALDGAFAVVIDLHTIAELDEQGLLELHEPDLQEVFADHVAAAQVEGLVHPGDLFDHRLFLHVDRTELASLRQAGHRALVDFTFLLAEGGKEFRDDGGIE